MCIRDSYKDTAQAKTDFFVDISQAVQRRPWGSLGTICQGARCAVSVCPVGCLAFGPLAVLPRLQMAFVSAFLTKGPGDVSSVRSGARASVGRRSAMGHAAPQWKVQSRSTSTFHELCGAPIGAGWVRQVSTCRRAPQSLDMFPACCVIVALVLRPRREARGSTATRPTQC